MVERVDDLISFIAYLALPAELFLAMLLYPRFFLAMPLVARTFGIFLFGFSFCCGGVHFLRAVQRTDSIQMQVLSWGTAFCTIGTAVFLVPNITIFFRSVDQGLLEQSQDNAILANAKRREEIFRGSVAHQLRNPIYAMEDKIRALEQKFDQDESQNSNESKKNLESSCRKGLKEIEALRDSVLSIINFSLDPEVVAFAKSQALANDDAFGHSSQFCVLDLPRVIQQTTHILQVEKEEETKTADLARIKRDSSPQGDEEDPFVETPKRLRFMGQVSERALERRRYGNITHVMQILYNLFSYAVAGCRVNNEGQVVIKYNITMVDYDVALKQRYVAESE